MGFLPDPLHPALIHFPIVLTLVGLLLDALSRSRRGRPLEPAGVVVMALAAVSAVVAVLSGDEARDEAVVPAAAAALVSRHEQLGELVMWLLIAVAVLRIVLAARGWFSGTVAVVYLLLATAVAAAVVYQGHLGGQMVFRYGVGTAPVQRELARS
jgi:uncharacterized membrane protein